MTWIGQNEQENAVKQCESLLKDAKRADSDYVGIETTLLEELLKIANSDISTPPHYINGSIETIDIIKMCLTPDEFAGYCKGNVIKYRERAPYKGNSQNDYKKARWYFEKLRE